MPLATPKTYLQMLESAKKNNYALPAINCTSTETINAAINGFAEAKSDGIIQFSTGGAEFASGLGLKNMVDGAVGLAKYTHYIAQKYDVTIALHTDHCPVDKLDTYVRPLLEISKKRVSKGKVPLFNSHMWDGSAIPLSENLMIAKELLETSKQAQTLLEIEIGVVGGEEDGIVNDINEKLYTTEEDFIETISSLNFDPANPFLLAATFGNVHGVYKPGNVSLRPEVLDMGQKVARKILKTSDNVNPLMFVFHGGSGSTKEEIALARSFGVVKMNIDTDTQYAFTREIAGHMFKNYDGVLRIDGEMGDKKAYDPRPYLKKAEANMSTRVIEACQDLGSIGNSISV